jgi:pimeloyl-ACP methyl ester carboxylesterase
LVVEKYEDLWSTVSGVSMYARRFVGGQRRAPTMVLVHGLGVSGRYMLPTAEALAADYPTFVPDLPGFGRSGKPSHILNISELANALAAWMHLVGLSHACLVGNSLASQFIVDLALQHPALVDAAVLIGPTMDSQARSFWKQVGRAALDMFHEPIGFWPLLTWDYLVAGPIRTAVTLRYALRDPVHEKLSAVGIPVLVIRGAHDPIAPQRWVEEMVQRLPHGRLLVLPTEAHVPNYSSGDIIAKAIREFLADGERTPLCVADFPAS